MLKYIGGGAALVVDQVPARNLLDDEVLLYGGKEKLLASGLYEEEKPDQINAIEPEKTKKDGK